MTKTDYELEKHYRNVGLRARRKNEETLTSFDRNIFWYNKDEIFRQQKAVKSKVTYADHRKVIETAVNMMRKDTQHDIAMCILTHRYFEDYRNSVFQGKGNFTLDYSFIIVKVAMLFNPATSTVSKVNIASRLKEYTTPTLVQINHITGTVTKVNTPETNFTLNEWAVKFNEAANESTTYHLAGLTIGT